MISNRSCSTFGNPLVQQIITYKLKTVALRNKFIRNITTRQMANRPFEVLYLILGDERILSKKCYESVEYINE